MKNRNIGFILIGISVLLLISLIIYNIQITSLINELMLRSGGVCVVDGKCVHQKSLLPLYIGSMSFILLFGFGIFFTFIKEKKEILEEKKNIEIPSNLDEDEKKIISILSSKEGSAYQSDLIRETNYSKVKITRILDRLEQRKLIDRKRRGMTNIVILK